MNFREIERKFKIKNYRETCSKLLLHYTKEGIDTEKILTADTIDDYWQTPSKADFVRVRNSWGESANGTPRKLKEITVKQKDKGTNLDRLELNLRIEEVELARAVCRLICGNRKARIEKREMVFFLSDATVVSVSRIEGQAYLEVEAPSVYLVEKHGAAIEKLGIELQPEPRSLFEIYVRGKNA